MAYSPIEDKYLSALTAVQFPDMPVEPEPPAGDTLLAAGPSQTMTDAGGGMPTIRAIEPTRFEKALQATGLTLEQAGRFLDSLGQVDVPLLGKISLADFVPFVGTAKEGTRSVLGPATWQGTPMALQQAGTGQSLTRGTGFARQLTNDASLAAMDVGLNIVPVGKAVATGGRIASKAAKATGKALTPKTGEMLGNYMQRTGMQSNLMAYHGTPHSVEKFDSRKIGSGEGAQAYGYGLYFAESKDVAQGYRVKLAYDPEKMKIGGKQINSVYKAIENAATKLPAEKAQGEYEKLDVLERLMMNEMPGDLQDFVDEMSPSTKTWFDKTVKPSFETYGNLYTVDIPDAMVGKMLDFDAPISSQSQEVQALAKKYNIQPDDLGGDLLAAAKGKTPIGAQKLREAGIPGVRYLDQGSRGSKESTRNIVVFPGGEEQIKILSREGNK